MSNSWSCKIAIKNGSIDNIIHEFLKYMREESPKSRGYRKGERKYVARYENQGNILITDFLTENEEGDDFLIKFVDAKVLGEHVLYLREGNMEGAYLAIYEDGDKVFSIDEEKCQCKYEQAFLEKYPELNDYNKKSKIRDIVEDIEEEEDSPCYKISEIYMPSLTMKRKKSGCDFKNAIWNDLGNAVYLEVNSEGVTSSKMKKGGYEDFGSELECKEMRFVSFIS